MTSAWCSDGLPGRRLETVAWVAFDLETTGLDPGRHAIREYAAYSVTPHGEISVVAEWCDDVDGADGFIPGLVEVANRVAAGAVLVVHNLVFDLSFLAVRPDAPAQLLRPPAWMCTLRMLPAPRSLDQLAGALGVTIDGRHTAAGDAGALAAALATLLIRAPDRGILDVGALAADAWAGGVSTGAPARARPHDVASGWPGVRANLDRVVPISPVLRSQRGAFAGCLRLLADSQRGPAHPIEHEAVVAALRGADITVCVLDVLVGEMG